MPIRAVAFDLFDTLVDMELPRFAPPGRQGAKPVHATAHRLHDALLEHADVEFERFNECLRQVDGSLGRERWSQDRELPTLERFRAVAHALGIGGDTLPQVLTHAHMGMLKEHVRPVPEHPALLSSLREQLPLALCSNFTHADTAREVLVESSLAPHLDIVVISEEVGYRKPHARIFESVLDGLRLPASDVLHVGDNLRADVAGAAVLGMRTAWLTRRVPDAEAKLAAHDGPRPDHVIARIDEIGALLGG